MVDDIKSQIVNSVTAQTQPQINDFFTNLNAQLKPLITIGIIVTVLWAIVMILGLVTRWRSHAALMRIDKNLQKLVAAQTYSESVEQASGTVPVRDSE